MLIIQLAAIGVIVMTTSAFGAERKQRQLPPTPQRTANKVEPKPSNGLQILKDSSQFMVKEFEDACKSHISIIKSSKLDPIKPEGYGTQIQYYTQQDKIGLVGNLNNLIKAKTDFVNKTIHDLDAEEAKRNTPFSVQDISKHFKDIYGSLNEGRKNCALSLSQIEKQVERTTALKDCQLKLNQLNLKKEPSAFQKAKASVSNNVKRFLPGSQGQKENQQPNPSETKETREEQTQRILRESLKKGGIG